MNQKTLESILKQISDLSAQLIAEAIIEGCTEQEMEVLDMALTQGKLPPGLQNRVLKAAETRKDKFLETLHQVMYNYWVSSPNTNFAEFYTAVGTAYPKYFSEYIDKQMSEVMRKELVKRRPHE